MAAIICAFVSIPKSGIAQQVGEVILGEVVQQPVQGEISVSFMRPGLAVFEGTVRSEDEALVLFNVVRSIRPDLQIVYNQLFVEASATPIPAAGAIPSFIEELILTTHEGFISSKPGEFLVSGLTDSLITRSVFEARLSLIEDESLHTRNLICLVATEDLPDASTDLPDAITGVTEYFPKDTPTSSSFQTPQPTFDAGFGPFGLTASAIQSLNLSGLDSPVLTSIDAGLFGRDRLEWIFLDEYRNSFTATPVIARPVSVAVPIAATPIAQNDPEPPDVKNEPVAGPRRSLVGKFLLRARPADKPEMKVLAPISFSEKNFTIPSDQMKILEQQVATLLSAERINDKIILCARVGGSGAAAFNEWISQRRIGHVRDMLVDMGVDRKRLSVEMKAAVEGDENPHRVDIIVPHHNRAEEATASIFRKKKAETEEAVPAMEPKDEASEVLGIRSKPLVAQPVIAQPVVIAPAPPEEDPELAEDPQPNDPASIFRKKPTVPEPLVPITEPVADPITPAPSTGPIFLDVD